MKLIDVKMQDVEIVSATRDPVQHQHIIGNDVADARFEAKGAGHTGHEFSRRDRVAARKQRHLMPESDQFFGEIVNNSLCPAIGSRGDAFDKRRDLGDTHITGPLGLVPSVKAFGFGSQRFAAQ